jgi:sugar phosphate isomerase/epimerase
VKLDAPGNPHLTYCTNIHPGESWPEVRVNIERFVLAVRDHVTPRQRFGIGLRLSAEAAEALARPGEVEAFRAFLDEHDLYVFTINGFPYGPFHGQPVKEEVYLPDWRSEARLRYSDQLATLLAALLPEEAGLEGSISTVPGAFRAHVLNEADVADMTDKLARHLATLHRLREETGKRISLALEPEPCCYLETVADTVAFFERRLFAPNVVRDLAGRTGMSRGQSEDFLRHHLGVCFDACHMAVEFEPVDAALQAFRDAGIRVVKIQISAGLRVHIARHDTRVLDALGAFADPVYLHQVVERRDGELRRYLDLPQALESAARFGGAPREWRIHFHVPLFREQLGPFDSTQPYVRELLDLVRHELVSQHLEVETYTWDVLPEEHRREDLVTAVARELRWVMEQIEP